MHKLILIITLSFLLSCSSEETTDISKSRITETGDSSLSKASQTHGASTISSSSLLITPMNANRNSTIYLTTRGFNLTGAKIEWLVNGSAVSSPKVSQFHAENTKKGDTVKVRATFQGKTLLSNSIEIKNTPPEISKISFLPEVFKPGDTLRIEALGSDQDNDEVTISYEWMKNGETAGNQEQLKVPLKRGDKISVKVTPFDGEVSGRSIVLNREILNLPPMIIDEKKYHFDGKKYTYQVKASDPDGDALTFSLLKSPPQMTIDTKTGLITWKVPPEYHGKTTISFSVTDGHGGEAMQSLTFSITPEVK